MLGKITKRAVEALEDGGWLWDTGLRGFGARRQGARVSYVIRYGTGRAGAGRRVTIGQHGGPWRPDPVTGEARVLTAELAREEAVRLRGLLEQGVDPADQRAAVRALPTVAEFGERYLRDYSRPPTKTAASAAEDRRLLEKVVSPGVGLVRLDRLTPDVVASWHASLVKTPTRANRALSLLSHMWTMAQAWGVLASGLGNPCARRHVKRNPETQRERFLTPEELQRVGAELATDTRSSGGVLAALWLLMLTGCRAGEIASLRWRDIHLERAAARLPKTKSGKPKTVYFSPDAVAFIRAYAEATPAARSSEWVFPARRPRGGQPRRGPGHLTVSAIDHAWSRIRARAGVEDVRAHDLRHTFASVMVQQGGSLPILQRILGHASVAQTERYAHLSADPAREAAVENAARVQAALGVAPPVRERRDRPGRRRSSR